MIGNDSGFTLIEVVLSLLMVGIMAAVAGMGIVWFAKGYVLVKDSTHTSQKAQLAMGRLKREMMELTSIDGSSDFSDFDRIKLESKTGIREIGLDNDTIKIAPSGTALADGDVLIDNVNNFNLTYYIDYKNGITCQDSGCVNDVIAVKIELELALSDAGVDFDMVYFLRNI